MTVSQRLDAAYAIARDALLAERTADGFWIGELSSSALSTAVAVIALQLVDDAKFSSQIRDGVKWLVANQNADGGWGDTTKSVSNISTSMLCRAALAVAKSEPAYPDTIARIEAYLARTCGQTPAERAEAIRNRYGKDRTFSVPILMTCAIAGLVPWREVPRLPFELACLPQSWYRFAQLPVVSYALPALIAIGQCVHHHRGTWNPLAKLLRRLAKSPSLRVLQRIQPSSGGYLEATPLTAFVAMALANIGQSDSPVTREAIRFIVDSVRPDGSWPIDTNLSIWVTTLSVNALSAANDLDAIGDREPLRTWLLEQQLKVRHPFTGADPGGWGWSHCPGSVPDCDDTPGAILALQNLVAGVCDPGLHENRPHRGQLQAFQNGRRWMNDLRNRDGGQPTFCRGWGTLPFDRSGSDLTAHALRADLANRQAGLAYLARQQRPDGSWLPLWFGNQHALDDINPVYGTARVLAAYRDLQLAQSTQCQRGVSYLLSVQNADGGWGGASDCPSSVEETAVTVEVLLDLVDDDIRMERGVTWLIEAVESGRFREPSPIGFYFAKLWYFEKLYPLIFTVAALGRARTRVTS